MYLTAIFLFDEGWQAGLMKNGQPMVVDVPDASQQIDNQTCAAAVKAMLRHYRANARSVVLVPPGHWWLAASVSTEGLLRRGRREALAYRLEDHLPIDAEQFVCDFLEGPNHALGVAIEPSRLTPVLTALDEQGVVVTAICPLPLLVNACLHENLPLQEDEYDVEAARLLVVEHANHLDLLVPRGRPRHWFHLPAEAIVLERHMRCLCMQFHVPLPVIGIGLSQSLRDALDQSEACCKLHIVENVSPLSQATEVAYRIAVQGQSPPVNLRRANLRAPDRIQQVRHPLIAALAAMLFALLAFSVMTYLQTQEYRQWAKKQQVQQEQLFRDLFPDQEVPAAVLARMESEVSRLRGISGSSEALPERASALHLMHAALIRLPQDFRFRILEFRVDAGRVYLEGQTRSHGDADVLAASLRHGDVFDIEPVRTESLVDRGVSFTLTGRPRQLAPGKQEVTP